MINHRERHLQDSSSGTLALRKKTVTFFPAHPSQIWLLRPIAKEVSNFARVLWLIRDKDCAVPLAKAFGLDCATLPKAGTGLLGNAFEFATNAARCWQLTRRHKIDVWVTKYGSGNMAARLAGKRSISFTDDDIDLIPLAAWTSFPFAYLTIATNPTRIGHFERSSVRYAGVGELCYLHPNRFTPDQSIYDELGIGCHQPFAIIRLSALQAHHDRGIRGASDALLRRVVELTRNRMRLFITSERPLSSEFEHLRFPLPADRIMHALFFAEFFLGDGQTMTTEAAVLGTPSFRINGFVGRISSMENVQRYGLTFGYRPGQEEQLLNALVALLEMPNRKAVFSQRRKRFLDDHIDPVPWHVQIIKMVTEGATRQEIRRWARVAGQVSHRRNVAA